MHTIMTQEYVQTNPQRDTTKGYINMLYTDVITV
jgi:hypothetical protein